MDPHRLQQHVPFSYRIIRFLLLTLSVFATTYEAFTPSLSYSWSRQQSLLLPYPKNYDQTHYFGVSSNRNDKRECLQVRMMMVKSNNNDQPLRFLGKGDRAVVRPGVVLVSPSHEYSHWLMRSAVFIHAIGLDEYGDHVTRGVIIDHPTAFTMGEMGSVFGTLGQNQLFRGGDAGNDSAVLLHSYGEQSLAEDGSGTVKIQCGDMIGMSGIFEGGVQDAMDLADQGLVNTERFKFFFNYVEFSDTQLENMMKEQDSDGDAWASFEVPSSIVLENDLTRGDTWSYLRNQMNQMTRK